jgi:hypothetical protein
MLEETEKRFRNKLKEDIEGICAVSDNLFMENDKFDLVFSLYKRYRDIIHSYMNQGKITDENDIKMDRHKIAAAFFCAILKAKPIGRKPDGTRFLERTANE